MFSNTPRLKHNELDKKSLSTPVMCLEDFVTYLKRKKVNYQNEILISIQFRF